MKTLEIQYNATTEQCSCKSGDLRLNRVTTSDGKDFAECNECLAVDLRDFTALGYSFIDRRHE